MVLAADVVVVLVVLAVMVVILRTQCECLVFRRVTFRVFRPLTSVEVKTRPFLDISI